MERSNRRKAIQSTYFFVQNDMVAFILFQSQRSIDSSIDFHLLFLPWKDSWNFGKSWKKLETLEVTISKSILKVYFIVRVYPEIYLKYSTIWTRQNTSRIKHNLWGNGVAIRGQVYQYRIPDSFESGWKNGSAFCLSKLNLIGIKDFWILCPSIPHR